MSQKKTGGKISLWKRFFLQSYSSAIVAIILLIFIFSVFTDAFLTPFNRDYEKISVNRILL